MKERWVLDIRDICERHGVDFFFKQWGGLRPKSGGRQLQGIEHNSMPVCRSEEKACAFQVAS